MICFEEVDDGPELEDEPPTNGGLDADLSSNDEAESDPGDGGSNGGGVVCPVVDHRG